MQREEETKGKTMRVHKLRLYHKFFSAATRSGTDLQFVGIFQPVPSKFPLPDFRKDS